MKKPDIRSLVVAACAAVLSVGSAFAAPGLKQYYCTFSGNGYLSPDNWQSCWDGTEPAVVPGALMAKDENQNGVTWKGTYYKFVNQSGYWYEGYVKLEAGKTYSAISLYDDGGCVYIDGQVVYQQGTTSGCGGLASSMPVPYKCTESGWHKIQLGIWDWTGGRGSRCGTYAGIQWTETTPTPESSTYSNKDVWHEYWDADADGNALGTYLCTEIPNPYISVTGSPAEYGTPSPAYGTCSNVTEGTTYTFTCPALATNEARMVYACTGWRLLLADGTLTTGTELSKEITYTDATKGSTLTWTWELKTLGWKNAKSSGNWDTASCWASGVCPTADDDVVIYSTNNITITAANGLSVKSLTVIGAGLTLVVGAEANAPQTILATTGDFTVTEDAFVRIYAGALTDMTVFNDAISNQTAATAAIYANPTVVSVGGTFTVADGGTIWPYNEKMSGAAVFFKPKNFNLAEGGLIDSRSCGWWCKKPMASGDLAPHGSREMYNTNDRLYTYCFGAGKEGDWGAGYGGKAYNCVAVTKIDNREDQSTFQPWTTGQTYGSAYAPFLSGSMAGGSIYQYTRSSGSIVVLATGHVRLAGTLNADGRATTSQYDWWLKVGGYAEYSAAPSGGGIWVCGKTVDLVPTAVLTAKGGDRMNNTSSTGCGGGGRISIGYDLASADWDALAATTNLPTGYMSSELPAVTALVEGGHMNSGYSPNKSDDGTITYVTRTAGKTQLTIVSDTENIIAENLEYGTFNVSAADELSYTVAAYGYDSTNPENVRYTCAGWLLTDKDGADAGSGETTSASFTLDAAKGPYTLTWKWNNRETRHTVVANGPGTVTVNGTPSGTGASIWKANSGAGTDTLVATPSAGATFVGWFGIPSGKATTATVTVPDAEGANYVAVFASAAPTLADKTWIGGTTGSWDDDASWEPSGVPTLSDDVKIASGFCLAPQGAVAHSIDVASGATFGLAASYDVDSKLVIENVGTSRANARFLCVADDFTCAGTAYFGAESATCTNLWLEVGGDLALAGTAFAEVTARPCWAAEVTTNALYEAATVFRIGGEFSLAGTAKLEPRCDGFTGAAVRFECETLEVAEGASVYAQERGWKYRAYTGDPDPRAHFSGNYSGKENYETCAFSPGYSVYIGGSHGGLAGYSYDWNRVYEYGYANAPFLPGSPNGNCEYLGGGVVWIKCTGEASVYGTLTAAASATWAGSGASGGSVWLLTTGLTTGANAALKADGQPGNNTSGGAGGRICLAIGLSEAEIAAFAAGETPAGVTVTEGITAVTATANGGEQWKSVAGAGTLRTLTGSLGNVTVNVAGSPLQAIGPVGGYGSQSHPAGKKVTFVGTTTGYGLDPEKPTDIRYACAGFEVRDYSGNLLTNGTSTTLVYEIPHEEVTVTWLWTDRQQGIAVDNPWGETFGSISINGTSYPNGGTSWGNGSETATIAAVPASGYEFLYWMGEFPYGEAKTNPLILSHEKIRHVTAIFRKAEAATTRTFKNTGTKTGKNKNIGQWLDPAAWDPANIPGLDDDVVITSGPCFITNNYIEVNSLTVRGYTWMAARSEDNLAFAYGQGYGWASRLSKETEELSLVVKGDLKINCAGDNVELAIGMHDNPVNGRLTVGGDFTMMNNNRFYICAGATNDVFTPAKGGYEVAVAGTFAVSNSCTIYPWSCPLTGGSVCFKADKFYLNTNATINADKTGFRQSTLGKPTHPGHGFGNSIGGGHGGYGTVKTEPHYDTTGTYGQSFDSEFAPVWPGGGTGYGEDPGGGLIRIHAREMTVCGKLTANAGYKGSAWGNCYGGAGGGIWLTADTFDFAETATFSVRGGDSGYNLNAEGGGGRIAIGRGLSSEEIAKAAGGARRGIGHRGTLADFLAAYPAVSAEAITIRGGIGYSGEGTAETSDYSELTMGTFRYVTPPHGLSVIVK